MYAHIWQKVKNALVLGIIMTIYSVVLLILHHQTPSDWMRITVLFAYIPLTYAGGKLNQLRTKANL
jgi:1,4-dihydroxy-2-naphthoate octaprenyltransferase